MNRDLTTIMSQKTSLLARLVALQFILFAALAPYAVAQAQDSAPTADQSGAEAGPIDLSITTQSPSNSSHAHRARNWKKFKLVTNPTEKSDERHRSLARTTKNTVVRNSIGVSIRQTIPNRNDAEVKTFTQPRVGNDRASAALQNAHRQEFAPLGVRNGRLHDLPINTAMNHAYINGRATGRAGTGTGAIGGPAKNVAGVISGSNFQVRHP